LKQLGATKTGRVRSVRGELDWIVMKALEKDRDRRYASASALADDVRRFRRHEPVQAGPPSLAYQARKFAQRHRATVIAAAVVCLAVIGGLGGMAWGFIDARAARDDAQARAEELEVMTEFQQGMLRDTKPGQMGAELFEELRAELTEEATDEESLARHLEAVDELARDVNHADLARRVLHRSILSRATESIDEQFADRPGLAASLHFAIGRSYQELSLHAPAEASLARAIEIGRESLGPDDERTIEPMVHLGYVLNEHERHDEAAALTGEALERARRALGTEHEVTLKAMAMRASWLASAGRADEADAMHLEAIALMTDVLGPEHTRTLMTKNQYANTLGSDRIDEVLVMRRQIAETTARVLGEDAQETLVATVNLASTLLNAGRFEEAAPVAEKALASYRRTLGDDNWLTANALNTYGYLLMQADRPEEAVVVLREAVASIHKFFEPENPSVLIYEVNLGEAMSNAGQLDESEVVLRAALEKWRARNETGMLTLACRVKLARTLTRQGRVDEALEMFRQSFATLDAEHPTARNRVGLRVFACRGLAEVGRFEECAEMLAASRSLAETLLSADDRLHAVIATRIADLEEQRSLEAPSASDGS